MKAHNLHDAYEGKIDLKKPNEKLPIENSLNININNDINNLAENANGNGNKKNGLYKKNKKNKKVQKKF